MSDTIIQLDKKYLIRGKIIAKSGLHIGGNDAGLSIGSPDSTVIKHPLTEEPYIPGSSLKGKMRSLFEISKGQIGNTRMGAVENGPSNDYGQEAARIYGNATRSQRDIQRPSRVIVRDALLSDEQPDGKTRLDYTQIEVKTEVVIDRITSRAMPRSIERVSAGAKFNLEIVVNVMKEGKLIEEGPHISWKATEDHLDAVLASLQLVQDDYLGGKGSRGSGQVGFEIETIESRTPEYYKNTSTGSNDVTSQYQSRYPELFKA